MTEKVEYNGRWWLPDNPDNQIFGILRFTTDEGAELDLDGLLEDVHNLEQMSNPEIIHGESNNDEILTLYKCQATSLGSSVSKYRVRHRSSYSTDLIFVGIHFPKLDDMKFKSISIHYLHLDEWLNITGFHGLSSGAADQTLKYSRPEPIKAIISNNYTIYLGVNSHRSSKFLGPKKISIEENAYIEIESQEEKSFDEFRDIMGNIENFVSLATMKPVFPLEIEGRTLNNQNLIKIFYSLWYTPQQHKALAPFEMLFTFKDISNRFENLLKLWFEKANVLKTVHLLYFSALYNPKQYLDYNFLSYVFAIESYHKITGKNHRLYFRKRINEIFDKCLGVIENFINENERDVFIQKVIDTRNYLVHHDMGLKDNTAKGQVLVRLTLGLKVLLEICLLIEIGFDLNQINTLFSKYRRYRYYKENRILSLSEKKNN